MVSKKEIIKILKSDDDAVLKEADDVRRNFVGDEIHLRGLVEFSNICKRGCLYCGLRCGNREIERYRMSKDEIVETARTASDMGYKTIVLQSGEDDFYSTDKMCEIISEIKKLPVALTLSIGEKSFEEFKAFKDAGADRYLLRIETTDKELYRRLHPRASFENRVKCLENLKELGYEVGTGCLVGLEDQSVESLANDILFFKSIEADMVGIGPFISHPQTPLNNSPNGDFETALRVMALTRIVLRTANIPATTAMETLNPNGRVIALQSGANVVMPNVTPIEYQNKYELYPNKKGLEFDKTVVEGLIKSIGRTVSTDFGFRK
ncbi:[bacterium]|nr:[FeFe] hydrogenase H-cluster radical SAM maturase HydE [bacterium]